MQHLSAYLMEIPDLNEAEGRVLYQEIDSVVDSWLNRKGVADLSADKSTFVSKTEGQTGSVTQAFFSNDQGDLREVILEEPTYDGHTFRTALRVVRSSLRVVVYLTLAARNSHSIIRPGFVVPRCPEIIHKIRGLRDDWSLGTTKLGAGGVIDFTEEADGIRLASSILSPRRTMPIVAVSVDEGEERWPGLSKQIARDLSALATLVRLSEEASWGLTDEVGSRLSCFNGAVRLYWPVLKGTVEHRVPGRVWTPDRLSNLDRDGEGMEKLRDQLRMTVMSAAALGVEPPFEIQEIRSHRARMRIRKLEEDGKSTAEELVLAQEFLKENEELREEIKALHQVIAQMKGGYEVEGNAVDEPEEAGEANAGEESPEPQPGETRFYKKTHSKPGYDVLVQVADCGHNNWESAHSAHKARKGLIRLEGKDDWTLLNHCATCTGGGRWRVRW
ncbi:syntaphilin domain-containing protein [Pinirhizobacter soli]|uniref:syntaphilin domain-containing protein n=1 Tax=Pinirhizobacter soli TaxID=2786953 RepID=UPI002029E8D7|nr:syntaphilin domain-containing protein [Pinirhizobacter soli]